MRYVENLDLLLEKLDSIKGECVYVEIHSSISLTHLLGEIQEIKVERNIGDDHINRIDVKGDNESITLWVEDLDEVILVDDLGSEEPNDSTEFLFKVTFEDGVGVWFHRLLNDNFA